MHSLREAKPVPVRSEKRHSGASQELKQMFYGVAMPQKRTSCAGLQSVVVEAGPPGGAK
jgi:hypothetical protein